MSGRVRSSAIEVAVADLERALCRDRAHAIFAVPPGPEKALLARTLSERLAGSHRFLHVHPQAGVEGDLCTWILVGLGEEPGLDAEAHLLDLLHDLSLRGSSLVLLLDDAGSMSRTTLRRLGRLAAASRSGLRLALAISSEDHARDRTMGDVVAALGVGAEKIELDARVEPAEVRVLARPEAPRSPSQDPELRAATPRNRVSRTGRALRPAALALGIAFALLWTYGWVAPARPPAVASEPPLGVERSAPPAEKRLPRPLATPTPALPPEPERVPQPRAAEEKQVAPVEVARAVKPRVRPVRVNLNAQPWARIEIDGKDVGVTPLANLPLAPGVHRFRAHLPDGRVIERVERVDAYRDHLHFP